VIRLGIIGYPACGKTTIFNALTGESLPTGTLSGDAYSAVESAVVDVPDPRLDALSELLKPRKKTYAKVTYADIGGMQVGQSLPGHMVNNLAQMDGLLHVVRAFDDPVFPHPAGSIDPARDHEALETELLLHDMLAVERHLTRLQEDRLKGGQDRAALEREISIFTKLGEWLEQGKPLRAIELASDEEEAIAGFGLVSRIPVMAIVNLSEGQDAPHWELDEKLVEVVHMAGRIEMEIAQLPDEEVPAFLEEYGIDEQGRTRVIRASCELLGLLSFFTVNEKEARAWTLRRGFTALDAAGMVHTDMARGFIRAEVIESEELFALGGLGEARSKGKLRLEGKDYVVKDGEILYIRFNV
jgi:GTP-binding protein YchF